MDTQARKENQFYGDDKQEWYLLTAYRFDKLMEMLEDLGDEQVLIWANYHVEFDIISGLLGDKCRCVYGKVGLEEKNEAIKLFKAGSVQYLIANPASADKGLTLTNAHIAIYFSLNWSYELFKQSTERIYGARRSQPKHCDYYIMIAKGTIDRVLYSDVLQGKSNASYAILEHLKGGGIS
jgi:SNF2 family DNA or RNA helicase